MAEDEKGIHEIRQRLINLVSHLNQEKDPSKPPKVEFEDVLVSVIPVAPAHRIDPEKFLELLERRIKKEMRNKILANCIEVKCPEATKLLSAFGITSEELKKIATEMPRGPMVEVKILAQRKEK